MMKHVVKKNVIKQKLNDEYFLKLKLVVLFVMQNLQGRSNNNKNLLSREFKIV